MRCRQASCCSSRCTGAGIIVSYQQADSAHDNLGGGGLGGKGGCGEGGGGGLGGRGLGGNGEGGEGLQAACGTGRMHSLHLNRESTQAPENTEAAFERVAAWQKRYSDTWG